MTRQNKNYKIAMAAVIAALYAALTYAQNFLVPGSATMAIQFRVSEALNVLALFSPTAVVGLTLGCVISNIGSIGSGLPLDMIFGSLATLGSTLCMYFLRNVKIKDYPLPAMLMPAIWNGVIIGWEIEFFFVEGSFSWTGFLVSGAYVAIGELAVMLILGTMYYYAIKKHKLHKSL